MNGRQRIIRGEVGDSAVILLNGETVNLQTSIKQNDRIIIKESTIGEPAVCTLDSLPEYPLLFLIDLHMYPSTLSI